MSATLSAPAKNLGALTSSVPTTVPPADSTASSRGPFCVGPTTSAAPAPSPSRSLRSMISLGPAAPPPATLLHASIVSPPHVAHCPAYLVPATHAQWTGLALHCEHLSAAVPRTDREQKPHVYVPSSGSASSSDSRRSCHGM